MKLLVTGGAGFIGSNFIHYWLKNNPEDKIVNFDKLTYAGNLENLKSVEDNPNYSFVKGDICDSALVNNVTADVDIVVHFAAESHVDRSIIDSSPFVQTNIVGTQVLLDAALKNGKKRFHHVSTDEVFGDLDLVATEKFNEETPYDPHSPYAASKAASDHLVRSFFHTHALPITISNCSNNYGAYQYPEKFISLAVTNLMEGKKIPVYGAGANIRDWLYVEDHCSAIEMIIKKGKIGETYCIGGQKEKEYTNMDIVRMILNLMELDEESNIEYVKDRPGHDRKYAVSWDKINKELGWEPKYDMEKWMTKTIEWYKDNKEWWAPIKSGEYKSFYKENYGNRQSQSA